MSLSKPSFPSSISGGVTSLSFLGSSALPAMNDGILIDFFRSSKALFCLLICFYRKVKINHSTNQIKQGDQTIIVIRNDLEFIFEVQLSLTDFPRVSKLPRISSVALSVVFTASN